MEIKIAVIMSVYQNDKLEYLKEAMYSLYSQVTYRKFDIFIQCDGVLPSKLEMYLDEEYKINNIKYLGKRDINRGLAYSLNELLIRVQNKYTYIVRMDADDISVPTRIEKQISFLEEHQDIQAVGGWIKEFNMDTSETQVIVYAESMKDIKRALVMRNPMAHVTICFRDSFFDTISTYDCSKSNEDLDLWIRALKDGVNLHNLQEVLVDVRTSNAFFARRKNLKRAIEVVNLKIYASKTFSFGIKGYLYAIAHGILFLLPEWIKHYIYKNLRG